MRQNQTKVVLTSNTSDIKCDKELVRKFFYHTLERGLLSMYMIQKIKPLIRNNASDENLIAAVSEVQATEKERNLVQGKYHQKAPRVYEVSSICNRSGQTEMDSKIDNSGSGKVDKLLSAVDAITNQVNSLKSELQGIKNEKRVTNTIVEVNIYVEIVLTITRTIVTIVINVGHQVIWRVDGTHHHWKPKCDYWCWVPSGH